MIVIEGYKAFSGVMEITPKRDGALPFAIHGDWLYKPDEKCWYGMNCSFPEEICSIKEENVCV